MEGEELAQVEDGDCNSSQTSMESCATFGLLGRCPSAFEFKGPGGIGSLIVIVGQGSYWILVCFGCGLGADGSDTTPPMAVVVPCVGRGLRGRFLSMISCYCPVSGAAFSMLSDDRCSSQFQILTVLSTPYWVL